MPTTNIGINELKTDDLIIKKGSLIKTDKLNGQTLCLTKDFNIKKDEKIEFETDPIKLISHIIKEELDKQNIKFSPDESFNGHFNGIFEKNKELKNILDKFIKVDENESFFLFNGFEYKIEAEKIKDDEHHGEPDYFDQVIKIKLSIDEHYIKMESSEFNCFVDNSNNRDIKILIRKHSTIYNYLDLFFLSYFKLLLKNKKNNEYRIKGYTCY